MEVKSQSRAGKIGFLTPKDEKIMLLLPFAVAAYAIIVFLMDHGEIGIHLPSGVPNLLVVLLLFDGVHVIWTMVALLMIPEIREWTKVRLQGRITSFWLRIGLVAATLAAVFYFARISDVTGVLPAMASVYLFLEGFGPSQHTLAQVKGLSLSYNSALRKAGEIKGAAAVKATANEKREKRFYLAILLGDTAMMLSVFLSPFGANEALTTVTTIGGTIVVTLASLGVVGNAMLLPGQQRSYKVLYLTRILAFPLRIFIGTFGWIINAFHGTEYLLVMRQMVKRSRMSARRRTLVYATGIAVTLVYVPIVLANHQFVVNNLLPGAIPDTTFLAALWFHLVVRFTHYYMDRMMYRMTNAHTRAAIGPLLVPTPVAQPVAPAAMVSTESAA